MGAASHAIFRWALSDNGFLSFVHLDVQGYGNTEDVMGNDLKLPLNY